MRYSLIPFLFILLTFVGCQSDFDWRLNRLDNYGKEFVDQYGWPDDGQTWNTAIQYQVKADIEIGGSWTMKIYTANPVEEPEKAYLIGRYSINTNGDAIVNVDGPYTLESVCVGIEDGSVYALKSVATNEAAKMGVTFTAADLTAGSLPEAQKMSYFLAYEIVDTLSSYLDFNDIILEVVHVSGEETLDVNLRAVGAEEKISVSYKDDNGKRNVLFNNVHNLFGKKTDEVINVETGCHNDFEPLRCKNLQVGSDFSIANNADRLVVTVEIGKKGKKHDFFLRPFTEDYLGSPSNVIVIANPVWDWMSEGGSYNLERSSFTFWVKSYRLYNQWWDTLWDPHNLLINADGSYSPDFDYTDMLLGVTELNSSASPVIDYLRLEPYKGEEVGVNISFVVTGRELGAIRIDLERSDGGAFGWYEQNATVSVFDDVNVDAGRGYAEACHVVLPTKTIKDIINCKATLRIVFDPKETNAQLNSVWIRGR